MVMGSLTAIDTLTRTAGLTGFVASQSCFPQRAYEVCPMPTSVGGRLQRVSLHSTSINCPLIRQLLRQGRRRKWPKALLSWPLPSYWGAIVDVLGA